MILCDVAREDASIVISDLRELRVHERGSIALEDIDSQVSDAAVRAEKYAVGLPSDAVVWEEVESRTSEDVELSASFLAFMVLAVMIAAVGILTDQIILIIGAMVVGPEFGPIAALSVAAVERRADLAKRSFIALALNLGAIFLASIGTLYLQRRLYLRRRAAHLDSPGRREAGLPPDRAQRRAGEASTVGGSDD